MGAVVLAAGVLTAAGSGSGIAKTLREPRPTVNDSMTNVMSVHAQTIWDISSKAFNAKGDGLVAKKIAPGDWKRLGEAGRLLKERALLLAKADHVVVSVRGEHVLGEEAAHGGPHDAASAKQIQAMIDHDRKQFVGPGLDPGAHRREPGEGVQDQGRPRRLQGLRGPRRGVRRLPRTVLGHRRPAACAQGLYPRPHRQVRHWPQAAALLSIVIM